MFNITVGGGGGGTCGSNNFKKPFVNVPQSDQVLQSGFVCSGDDCCQATRRKRFTLPPTVIKHAQATLVNLVPGHFSFAFRSRLWPTLVRIGQKLHFGYYPCFLEAENIHRRGIENVLSLCKQRVIHLFAGRAVKRERRKGSSRRQQPAYGAAVNEVARELLRSARSPKRENGGRRYIKHDG